MDQVDNLVKNCFTNWAVWTGVVVAFHTNRCTHSGTNWKDVFLTGIWLNNEFLHFPPPRSSSLLLRKSSYFIRLITPVLIPLFISLFSITFSLIIVPFFVLYHSIIYLSLLYPWPKQGRFLWLHFFSLHASSSFLQSLASSSSCRLNLLKDISGLFHTL